MKNKIHQAIFEKIERLYKEYMLKKDFRNGIFAFRARNSDPKDMEYILIPKGEILIRDNSDLVRFRKIIKDNDTEYNVLAFHTSDNVDWSKLNAILDKIEERLITNQIICNYCESEKALFLSRSTNVLGWDMEIYKCNECGSKFSTETIPNPKFITINNQANDIKRNQKNKKLANRFS